MEIYEEQIIIPLAIYSGAGPVDSLPLRALGATGAIFVLYTKTAGTSTLALRLVLLEPFESQEALLNASKTIIGASRFAWIVYPGVAPQPAGEAAVTTLTTTVPQTVSLAIPGKFVVRVEKGDTSPWEFGVSMRRIS